MICFIGCAKPFPTFVERASLICDECVLLLFVAFSLVLYFCKNLLARERQLLGYGMMGLIGACIFKNLVILVKEARRQYRRNKQKKEEQEKTTQEESKQGPTREELNITIPIIREHVVPPEEEDKGELEIQSFYE